MLFKFNSSTGSIILPKEPFMEKINGASEAELKVLLFAAASACDNNGVFDETAIQKTSGLDLNDIIFALQFWRGAGVIAAESGNSAAISTPHTVTPVSAQHTPPHEENAPADNGDARVLQKFDIPTYSGEAVARLFEANPELVLLIEECNKIAGKILNPFECNKIIAFYDYLDLSAEFILSVYNYCAKKNKTTVHYLEKTVFNLYNEGVDTDEKLRDYLKQKEEFESLAGHIRRLFGMGQRALTKAEKEHITKWKDVYNITPDMLEYAYELTANSASKPSIAYMSRILDRWHSQGITTLQQAKDSEINFKKSKEKTVENNDSSFDDTEFFNAALQKSYSKIGKKPTSNQ